MNPRSNALNTSSLFNSSLLSSQTGYAIQEWTIPGIVINHQELYTKFGILNIEGDIVDYNPLDMKLVIDEELLIWKELISVFQKYQIPGTNTCAPISGDSWIQVYDSKNNYLFKITFFNCYLKSIGDLRYSSIEDNEIITVDLSIVYDYYIIE